LLERVRNRLADSADPVDLTALARQESRLLVDSQALATISERLDADLRGAGPLERLLELSGVTDVLVNGPTAVYLDRGLGLERAPVSFEDDAAIRLLAVRLASQAGRRLDDALPYVDASLPDGTRLHAVLPPLVRHPTICLRVLRRRRLGLDDLTEAGMMAPAVAELLRAVVAARLTTLISGGTGTGKTTLLGALLSEAGADERVLTIEDAAELVVEHPHVVGLLARNSNAEGAGAVSLGELVRQSLRMRADRIAVGEFRGAEIVDLLAALNTGHTGGAATVHANSVADVPARLVALAALGGMAEQVLAAQAASALDVVVQLGRRRDRTRMVAEIALWPRDSSRFLGAPPLVWSDRDGLGPAVGALAARLSLDGGPVPALLAASQP
jgi:pilus assembly protein CpaF